MLSLHNEDTLDLDGLLLLLPVDEVPEHGPHVLLPTQATRLLGSQEPHVVGRLFNVVFHVRRRCFLPRHHGELFLAAPAVAMLKTAVFSVPALL